MYQDISKCAIKLLNENYVEGKNIRSLTLSVTNLENPNDTKQLNLFEMSNDSKESENKILENVTKEVDKLKDKYGNNIINFGSVIDKKV